MWVFCVSWLSRYPLSVCAVLLLTVGCHVHVLRRTIRRWPYLHDDPARITSHISCQLSG